MFDFIAQIQKSTDNIIEYNMGNNDGCVEQYRCSSAIYLMLVMSQCYSIIIYLGISAPGHGKYVVYVLNDVDNHYIFKFVYSLAHNIP